jgi:hypothetical protein
MFNDDFYPTPFELLKKLNIKLDRDMFILEPSAGKGDIIDFINKKYFFKNHNADPLNIDCIELDSNLIHILKGKGCRVVHNDFLSFNTYKNYDLIIMNPPFSLGARHLLKAIEMQENNGGKIVCFLNAETIKNVCTVEREILRKKIEKHVAKVEFIDNAFSKAERKTNVQVAIIEFDIPVKEKESILLNHLKQEEIILQAEKNINNEIVSNDFVESIVTRYNFEIKAGIRLINEYEKMKPLIMSKVKEDDLYNAPILTLSIKGDSKNMINGFIKKVRAKYWNALFMSDEFMNAFTTNLRNDYRNKIDDLENYDFSVYNIETIKNDLNNKMVKAIEDTIMMLFDDFSHTYHWYSESENNVHYFNGWATNKAHCINKKVIIPLKAWDWGKYNPHDYQVREKIMDIEKVFNYLSGDMKKETGIDNILVKAKDEVNTKNIELEYFYLNFYKKGTCHILFKDLDLLKKFNIFGCQKKGWLPPVYGKKKYDDMNNDEKTVIDSFEGEKSYKEVINNKDKFLLTVENLILLEGEPK